MADPRFYDRQGPFAASTLAEAIGAAVVRDGTAQIVDVASIDGAAYGDLCYALAASNVKALADRTPAAILVPAGLAASLPEGPAILSHPEPARAFAKAVALFYLDAGRQIGSRDGRAIASDVRLGQDVIIEAGVVIGAGAEIGDGSHIAANAVIGRGVKLGRNCFVGPLATVIYALLGDRVTVMSGARIGNDGFGFVPGRPSHTKIPQVGRVILQDDVEIGANCTIDRGALGDTIIGEGTKLDDLVHIGHNTVIGRRVIFAGQSGVSGSTIVGDEVVFGGQSGAVDHIKIGDRARIAARAAPTRDVDGDAEYGGFPAQPLAQWRREMVTLRRLTKGMRRRDG